MFCALALSVIAAKNNKSGRADFLFMIEEFL